MLEGIKCVKKPSWAPLEEGDLAIFIRPRNMHLKDMPGEVVPCKAGDVAMHTGQWVYFDFMKSWGSMPVFFFNRKLFVVEKVKETLFTTCLDALMKKL